MLLVSGSDEWTRVHKGAVIGLLELSGVDNKAPSPELESRKREAERELRSAFDGYNRDDFLKLPVMAAYRRYYKQFKKTYHVQLQLESIVRGDRDLPAVSPLVDANFLAEMTTMVLTAGHDAARLQAPIMIDVSGEGDLIDQFDGETRALRPGDMIMRDARGVCCSIIYGQDGRSPITPATDHVLYVSYAPAGVSAELVQAHLESIEHNVRLFAPSAKSEQLRLIIAGQSL